MFSDPEQNISQFELIKGSHVADFGSGSGFYSFSAAEAVGEDGKVYAIDVQKDLLQKLNNEAKKVRHLTNIEIIWGDLDDLGGTKLKESSIDAVIAANIFFQLENKENACLEIKRILKNKGRVLLIDWIDINNGNISQGINPFTKDIARDLFIKNGFTEEREFEAGIKHYGLIFVKK